MGQFNSNCPKCNADIYWFLKAPENYVCRCGQPVSKVQIEESWELNYKNHIGKLIVKNGYKNLSAERIGKDFSMRQDFIQEVLDNHLN